jgi:hypothetical protein
MSSTSIPQRIGQAPDVFGPAPHGQASQVAPIMLQEELWNRMRGLPSVYMAPTLVSVPHARSLFLPEHIGRGPDRAFQAGREFAHIHPHHDGSLHVTLPESLQAEVEAGGWGIRHPHPKYPSISLLYGPRDRDELEVAWYYVQSSYEYAMGRLA